MSLALTFIAAALAFVPPSGRPPVGPLSREKPRVYDLTYEVRISSVPTGQLDPNNNAPLYPNHPDYDPKGIDWNRHFKIRDTPIVMPLIMQSTFNIIDQDTLQPKLWLQGREDTEISSRARIDDGMPFHTKLAVLPIAEFNGQQLRFSVSFKSQVWSSRIDDEAAGKIPWPREWPREVADGLKPQMYIDSNDPIFKETVDRISEGNLQIVPPYYAAKDIVRHTIENIQVTGTPLYRGSLGRIQGMIVNGAANTARRGIGRPIDLVCVCVAMLRAANIPARPVIGVGDDERGHSTLMVWAEFFLPECGWIPFDPIEMRGKGLTHRDVRRPWAEFGTMKDLNRRIPLSYHFMPAATVQTPRLPAIWGWDPRGEVPNADQTIQITTVSRGPGQKDPDE